LDFGSYDLSIFRWASVSCGLANLLGLTVSLLNLWTHYTGTG